MKKIKGFTLIELLIVLTIVGVLFTIVFVNPKNYYTEYLVNSDAVFLKTVFEKVKTYEKTGFKFNEITLPENGYGVYLNINTPNEIIVFNDRNKNFYYNLGEEVEKKNLENSLIEQISINQSNFNFLYKNGGNIYINAIKYNENIIINLGNESIKKFLLINPASNIIDVK